MKTDEEEDGQPWKIMEKNILGREVAGAKTWSRRVQGGPRNKPMSSGAGSL